MDLSSIQGLAIRRLNEYLANGGTLDTVATFTGAVRDTVGRWQRNDSPARGENLVKLWVFLEHTLGPAPELNGLHPYVRYVTELFAFGLIDIDEATRLFKVKNAQSAWVIMRGQNRMGKPPTDETFAELKAQYDTELKARHKQLRDATLMTNPPIPVKRPSTGVSAPAAAKLGNTPNEVSAPLPLLMLASHLKAALPWAEFLNSDACSDDVRNSFRVLYGPDDYEALIKTLTSLRGKKAREFVLEGRKSNF